MSLFFYCLVIVIFGVGVLFYVRSTQETSIQKTTTRALRTFGDLKYPFSLPALLYTYNALEPHIDEATMNIHHTKHHQAYINSLNECLEKHPEFQSKSLVDLIAHTKTLPESLLKVVENHGGGHANHSMFWLIMSPQGGGQPEGKLAQAIDKTFGSFENFKKLFIEAAKTRFGSGWAWLCVDSDNNLVITSTANQDNPMMDGLIPVLGLDIWEHAYYLKYQNKRIDYVNTWWNVINWPVVAEYFAKACSK
ncbi:superoxide dismutase [bacterium]|nr:MAG: superoxide dismutase [bacterium]